jgi:predicted hotdog family 3-hydroxylacyl-ACP dehydratase
VTQAIASVENIPIEALIAHRPPMILIDRVVEWAEDAIRVAVVVRENAPFMVDGHIPAYVAVEYMAQAIAAYSGLKARQNQQPVRIGFLLGTRRLTLAATTFEPGQDLIVECETLYNDGEMASFDCRTLRDGQVVAAAALNVFQPASDRPLTDLATHG